MAKQDHFEMIATIQALLWKPFSKNLGRRITPKLGIGSVISDKDTNAPLTVFKTVYSFLFVC